MSDSLLPRDEVRTSRSGAVMPLAVSFAILAAVGSLVWAFLLQQRLTETETKLAVAMQDRTVFGQQLREADARIRANSVTVDQQLTRAQQEQAALVERAQAIAARQQADTSRLEKTQADTAQKIGAVATDVSSVKSDVGSVRTEVASTKTDVADTKALLQRTIGDAGVMSGLIARNHDEVEQLKHRGDRTYYEFTLHKNAPGTLLSTIKLQLKKTNEKKSRFNLLVSSDDRNIEKKDKTVLEPIQFYSGKDPVLFEIVVNSLGHDTVSGYLSVPKGM